MRWLKTGIGIAVLAMICAGASAQNPFIGRWGLDVDGSAGWLEITNEGKYLDGRLMWIAGSVLPVSSVYKMEDGIVVTRVNEVEREDESGDVVRTHQFTETLVIRQEGDGIVITRYDPRSDGSGIDVQEVTGFKLPPTPDKPDLSHVKFGDPIALFNGNDLDGWKLTEDDATSAWSVQDGVLVNNPERRRGVHYGNLRTVNEFEDFNLTLDVNLEPRQNSGVYLRGVYEIQMAGSFGEEPDSHNMGALYSRITPRVNALDADKEWQQVDITLVDRHVTVKVNGQTVIDNEPVQGCTGGALWADETKPGPIYLQGDHTGVKYRNIVLKPVID